MNLDDLQIDPEEFRHLFTGEIQYPKEIGFYLDESADQRIRSLWTEGIEVTTVEEQGQKGIRSDIRILAHARQLGYVLITKDLHFEEIHYRIQEMEGTAHAGIVLIKSDEARTYPSKVIGYIMELTGQSEYAPDIAESNLIYI